ncbi:YibE/F family protein [Actinophytocola sp.]|uniref:YibE/F family protein n=1 Tax=Actinophytocola sp. TaxID=1872138 RepID=UPI003D6A80AA
MHDRHTEPIPRVTDRRRDARDADEPDEPPARVGHHHDHAPPPPASSRVRTLLAVLLVPFALAAVVGTVLLFPFGDQADTNKPAGTPVHGVVTAAQAGSCSGQVQVGDQPGAEDCLVVRVRMTDGDAPGQEIRTILPLEPSTPRFAVDDEVVLAYGGGNPTDGGSYQLVDFQREIPLALLAGLFAVVVLLLGRWQGLKALAALGLSFAVLALFVLPAIIAGENPLLVGIFGAGLIMFAVLYLTHGLTARTSTAVLGTMVSLALIGVLGALWAAFAKLTGLDDDTSTLVGLLNTPIDTRGLLLAGVVIGALGVLDDVTVTQTSAVWELRAANPALTRLELYTSALRIGRDHVASAVNTLVMAYAGAALPLLLYSSIAGVGLGNILTSQVIAQEIVRTLVGSIGLIAAVPITTFLAATVAATEPAPVRRKPVSRGSRRTA